jgi:hypothetical protein
MRLLIPVVVATLAGTAAAASPSWQPLGENANGNKVYVNPASVRTAKGLTTVTYRTELKAPMDTPGGAITSMRSTMQVNCKAGTAAGLEVVLYEDEAKGRIFARNKAQKVEFLKEPAGSAAEMVVRHVCK